MKRWILGLALALLAGAAVAKPGATFESRFADNRGVRLHYMAAGSGPLVVMLHGFPEYWGFYRPLMGALRDRYRVVAVDLRGYNLSDKPPGVAAYAMPNLVADVEAVIRSEGRRSAIVVGHDWGAAIAWQAAITRPELVDRLAVMSVPHPAGFARELATNPVQQRNSQYARNFQQEGFERNLRPEMFTAKAPEPLRSEWTEALRRTDFTAALNYYRANYPRMAPGAPPDSPPASLPPVKAPTLVIHGMQDQALLAAGHSGTWDHVQADTTLLMIPSAGHDVQHDAQALVNRTVRDWLDARR